jgi:hypothetical protein
MMTFGYSFQIWVPLLIFPTAGPYGAPRWQHGWPVTLVFYFLLWAGFITALVLHRRSKKCQQMTSTTVLSGADDTSKAVVSVDVLVNDKLTG